LQLPQRTADIFLAVNNELKRLRKVLASFEICLLLRRLRREFWENNEELKSSPSPSLCPGLSEYETGIITTHRKVWWVIIELFLNEIRVFWNVTSCSSVDKYPHFGGACYHCLLVRSKVAGCSDAVVPDLPNCTGSHTLRN